MNWLWLSSLPITSRISALRVRFAIILALPSGFAGLLAQASAADRFVDRESLRGASFLASGNSQNATADAGEPSHAGSAPVLRSLWWQWTAAVSGPVRIETTGSNFDTVLAVYTGSALGSLVRVTKNDDAGVGATSCVTFHATAGVHYQVAVDDFTGAGGLVVLHGTQMAGGLIYVSDFGQLSAGTNVIAGKQGWQGMFSDGAEGVETSNGVSRAFITGAANTGNVSGLWLPVNVAEGAGASSRVLISTECEVRLAAGAEAMSFFHLVYDEEGIFQGGLEFDARTSSIFRLDGTNRVATGRYFVSGQTYALDLMIAPAANTWTARLGGVILFENAPFSAVDTIAAAVGSLVMASSRDEGVAQSTSRMLFRDVFIAVVDSLPVTGADGGVRLRIPFFGAPEAVPGRIEAENFDEGGAGISYLDTSPGNEGGAYRPGGVDIEEYNGSRHIGWFKAGEWMSYSVDASYTGTYRLDLSVASYSQGGRFRVEIDSVDVSGSISVPSTGGWVAWNTVSIETRLSKGAHDLRIVGTSNSDVNHGYVGNIDWLELTAISIDETVGEPPVTEPPASEPPATEPPTTEPPVAEAPATEPPATEPSATEPPGSGSTEPEPPVAELPGAGVRAPFHGTAHFIPGLIEAEWFDEGGAEVAFSDTTIGNSGGAYRAGDVDIEELDGSAHIGWFRAGEWLLYSASAQESGIYRVEVRVASNGQGGSFRIDIDGTDATGMMTIPDTGGWGTWHILSAEVTLAHGAHDLRIAGLKNSDANNGNIGNIDWLRFVRIPAPVVPQSEVPPAGTPSIGVISIPAPTQTGQGIGLSWTPSDGAVQYEIWRSSTGSYETATKMAATSASSWEDVQLSMTGEYTYWIRSFSSTGQLIGSGAISAGWTGPVSRLVNISSRGRVLPGQPVIAGFVVEGGSSRRVLVRAIGPALGDFGITESVDQPMVNLVSHAAQSKLAEVRHGWAEANASEVRDAMASSGAFELDPTARDVAFVINLEPGEYTAEMSSAGSSGVGLVEVYALDHESEPSAGRLLNISTRSHAGSGSDALIAGFVVSGTQSRRILVRGAGPALAGYGVAGYMENPELRVYAASDDSLVAQNDDWVADSALASAVTATGAFSFQPGSRDAAVLIELAPGTYTAVLVPASGGEGVALVEVYEVPVQ